MARGLLDASRMHIAVASGLIDARLQSNLDESRLDDSDIVEPGVDDSGVDDSGVDESEVDASTENAKPRTEVRSRAEARTHGEAWTRGEVLSRTEVRSRADVTTGTEVLERSAAYVAARSHLDLIRAATMSWPTDAAQAARQRAGAIVTAVAQSLEYPPTSAARRRCVRNAIGNALELSAMTDVARAQGLAVGGSLQAAGRMMSLLAFAFHATLVPDD